MTKQPRTATATATATMIYMTLLGSCLALNYYTKHNNSNTSATHEYYNKYTSNSTITSSNSSSVSRSSNNSHDNHHPLISVNEILNITTITILITITIILFYKCYHRNYQMINWCTTSNNNDNDSRKFVMIIGIEKYQVVLEKILLVKVNVVLQKYSKPLY